MTFFPNSKGIQFFLSEMIFRIHPTLTSIPLPQGISSNLSVEIPMILSPIT
jgi:hypothetical protein